MLKKLILLLSIFTFSFSKTLFWDTVDNIENKFYILDNKDNNQSHDEKYINETIENKNKLFTNLVKILKDEPYQVNLDNSNNENNSNLIIQKIKLNKQYGYDLAVVRDEIKLASLDVNNAIYVYFVTLSNNWTTFRKEDLEAFQNSNIEFLRTIKYDKFYDEYKKVYKGNGNVEQDLKKNFEELHKSYLFFKEFLSFISVNKSMLEYKSITNLLKLNILIDNINSNFYFKKVNTYLRFIHTDMGRLTLFFTFIILFVLLNILVNKRIYNYFTTLVIKQKHENEDILLDNLNYIRRPLFLIITSIGLKSALEVLVYPHALNESILSVFYLFYIISVTYIIFIIIDNILFAYLSNKNDTDSIRKELIMLVTSVSKIIVFLIGFLLFLVKLGVNISGILTSLGIGGLAVALAAQSTLSNFFGLIKMILDKSFSQGDWIETKDLEGTVVEIGFISTKIRTFDNALITVPNSSLANTAIKNWNRRKIGRRIKMNIGVTYSSKQDDLEKAINDIRDMLIKHKSIVTPSDVDYSKVHRYYKKERKLISIDDKYGVKTNLLVYLDNLSSSSIDILIYAFSKTVNWKDWLEVKQDIILEIWKILEKHNLEFAFPTQTIHLENEDKK